MERKSYKQTENMKKILSWQLVRVRPAVQIRPAALKDSRNRMISGVFILIFLNFIIAIREDAFLRAGTHDFNGGMGINRDCTGGPVRGAAAGDVQLQCPLCAFMADGAAGQRLRVWGNCGGGGASAAQAVGGEIDSGRNSRYNVEKK